MPPAPLPFNERQRVAALHALGILDTEYEERFDRITRLAQRLYGTEMVAVTLIDTNRQWFKSKQGPLGAEDDRDTAFCAHAILEPDQTMVVGDAREDERFADNPLVTGDPNIRFYAGHPIAAPGGEPLGTLCVIDSAPRAPEDVDTEALRDLAEMVESEIASMSLAIGDPLTGLSNRLGFDKLGAKLFDIASRVDVQIAVIYADLDNLKTINDAHGHDAGDRALIEIADILQSTLRESDVIARLGGDEFCSLLAGVAAEDAQIAVTRIQHAIARRNGRADEPFELSMSIGVATDRPAESNMPLAQLVEAADAKMFEAKRAAKATRRFSAV